MHKINKGNYFIIPPLLITVLFLFFAISIFIVRGYSQKMTFLGGDEPHYIMMTDSLVRDGDLNLKNDYEQSRSDQYYPIKGLFPHIAPIIDYKNSNNWYSIHTIGLPLLIYYPYKIFGVIGARLFLMALQILSIVLFYMILKKYLKDKLRVFLGIILVFCSSILWQNIGGIFPDYFTVLLLEISILLFARKNIISNLALAITNLIGLLLHTKIILLIGPIFVAHNLYLMKNLGLKEIIKKYFVIYIPVVVGLIYYIRFLKINYGIFSPSQIYGTNGQLFTGNYFTNSLAILTDRTKGLFIYFPLLLILPIYLFRGAMNIKKKYKNILQNKTEFNMDNYLLFGFITGTMLLLLTQIGFNDWSGSYSPNGRYMLVFIFIAIFMIAKYVNYKNILEIITIATLSFCSLVISVLFVFNNLHYFDTGQIVWPTSSMDRFNLLPVFPIISSNAGQYVVMRGIFVLLLVVVVNFVFYKIFLFKRRNITSDNK